MCAAGWPRSGWERGCGVGLCEGGAGEASVGVGRVARVGLWCGGGAGEARVSLGGGVVWVAWMGWWWWVCGCGER